MPDPPVSQSDTSAKDAEVRAIEPASSYPPKLDPEIVKATGVGSGVSGPMTRARSIVRRRWACWPKTPPWRATPQGEGVLIALGLLPGEPASTRTRQVVLWAVSERYPTPQLVRLWSEWQDENGTLDAELDEVKADFESYGDSGPWRYFTQHAMLDIPPIPEPEGEDDA